MKCNLRVRRFVKSASCRRWFVACLIGLAGLTTVGGKRAEASPASLDAAENALGRMQTGDLRTAAALVRKALDADPGDTLLHSMAATLLLLTGDKNGASSEWSTVLTDMPGDPLSLYGSGLAALARNDKAAALDLFHLAERDGDKAVCLLAERYVESIGAAGGDLGLTLPDEHMAAVRCLNGMGFASKGDAKSALEAFTDALSALPGDAYAEPTGPLMTFIATEILRFGDPPLPMGNGLSTRRKLNNEKIYSGVVQLSPGSQADGAGYIVYKIDGNLASIANSQPFKYVWDTGRVPNGPHHIEIITYDNQGREYSKASETVRTANINAPTRETPESIRSDRVKYGLWRLLALKPSRLAVALLAAEAARKLGDVEAADRMLLIAASIDPGYGGVRAKLTDSISVSGPALWKAGAGSNVVALTFDDGPKPGITEQLLAILAKENVPATFFVIGRHVAAYPELTRKIAEAGMSIQNHSYTHPNLAVMPEAEVERELVRTMAAVRAVTGKKMSFYRPPGGNLDGEVGKAASRWGLTACMWTVDGEALENGGPDRLVSFVLQRANAGAIILLHNGRITTVEALPAIIQGLRKKGLRFVTVEEMAKLAKLDQ